MGNSITLRSLREKAIEIEARFDQLRQERDALHIVLKMFEDDNASVNGPEEPTLKEEITNAMEEIFKNEQPLHRTEILRQVRDKGIFIGGRRPLNSISSYLSIDPRFKVFGRGLWGLARQPDKASEPNGFEPPDRPMLQGLDRHPYNPVTIIDDERPHSDEVSDARPKQAQAS